MGTNFRGLTGWLTGFNAQGAAALGNDCDVAVDLGAAPGGQMEKPRRQAPSLAEIP
jgi:hypothetical protein